MGTDMGTAFKNERQHRAYRDVLSNLKEIGYTGQMLQENYPFGDWFDSSHPLRKTPAAAFGRSPPAYDNACFGVLVANGVAGKALVTQYRALGAPLALEIDEEKVTLWRVGHDDATTTATSVTPAKGIGTLFKQHREDWAADAILRAKNIGVGLGSRQRDLFDMRLIPALEGQIRERLHVFLNELMEATKRKYHRQTGRAADEKLLFRLVFRLLAAKVLHDKGVPPFAEMGPDTDAGEVLREVSRFYQQTEAILDDVQTQQAALALLWEQVGFQNLSAEVLAYIYENTLVSKSTRRQLGTHSTPSSIARYLVSRLPFEDVEKDDRVVVEPCCGHAVFLVAALQRLRQLLPSGVTPARRHQYLVRMLRGFEIDSFALEVGKLCLMLADFPNADGWQLWNKDVFAAPEFTASLGQARFILANPPFEDFSEGERAALGGLRSVRKPAELLHRVLQHKHPQACLGFVLPRQFIDGDGYQDVRETLARRFGEIEVVALPDGVFHVSKTESALLIAKRPRDEGGRTAVGFSEVSEKGRDLFLNEQAVTRQDARVASVAEATVRLSVVALSDVWEWLDGCPRLSALAAIHRGIEWSEFDEATCYSPTRRDGYRLGYGRIRNDLAAFQPSRAEYLDMREGSLRKRGGGREFLARAAQPKAILNAARISRGPWRLAAFVDRENRPATQSFHGVWPSGERLSVECIAAVLNGPVASLFVATHEQGRHNSKQTVGAIPVPQPEHLDTEAIERAVADFTRAVGSRVMVSDHEDASLYDLLLRIDALVLKGYALPPRLEVKIIDFVRGHARPAGFAFTQYNPEKLVKLRFSSGGEGYEEEWESRTARRTILAQKLLDGKLNDAEDRELAAIDQALDRFTDTVSPLPFAELERLERLARMQAPLKAGD